MDECLRSSNLAGGSQAPTKPCFTLVATFHTAWSLLNSDLGIHGHANTKHLISSSARLCNGSLPNSVPDLLVFVRNRSDCVVARAAMATRESSEVLKNAGDQMVDLEDLFGNPKKEWRNPLVLCGAVATAGVLVAGLASFRQGNYRTSQMLMRTRIIFQAATVALMTGSVYFQGKS